jgi:hypothetical protein
MQKAQSATGEGKKNTIVKNTRLDFHDTEVRELWKKMRNAMRLVQSFFHVINRNPETKRATWGV